MLCYYLVRFRLILAVPSDSRRRRETLPSRPLALPSTFPMSLRRCPSRSNFVGREKILDRWKREKGKKTKMLKIFHWQIEKHLLRHIKTHTESKKHKSRESSDINYLESILICFWTIYLPELIFRLSRKIFIIVHYYQNKVFIQNNRLGGFTYFVITKNYFITDIEINKLVESFISSARSLKSFLVSDSQGWKKTLQFVNF